MHFIVKYERQTILYMLREQSKAKGLSFLVISKLNELYLLWREFESQSRGDKRITS